MALEVLFDKASVGHVVKALGRSTGVLLELSCPKEYTSTQIFFILSFGPILILFIKDDDGHLLEVILGAFQAFGVFP